MRRVIIGSLAAAGVVYALSPKARKKINEKVGEAALKASRIYKGTAEELETRLLEHKEVEVES